MLCFVTGASGFIGANLVHALVAQGHRVRAYIRPESNRRGLRETDYEPVLGELGDASRLRAGMRGCDWCFHVAASYHFWLPDYEPMYATNVTGTRNVLTAATAAGCSRIVYTSTVGCIGLPKANGHGMRPSDESAPLSSEHLVNHYKHSKWQAEQVARELAAQGHPIIIVNPTAPVGPRDVKPTPTGRVIVNFLNGAMPAYLDTGLNWVHVRDVAAGHILAAERGNVGQRYILGNETGNWTLAEMFRVLTEVSGVTGPQLRMPYWAALSTACIQEGISWFSGKPPTAALGAVRMARHKMYYTPRKAIQELGLPQTPARDALAEAVEWFRQNGYTFRR
jgi:dihydroflavonol-4-reductase